MTANVGKIDRLFRAILGVVLIVLPFLSGMTVFQNSVMTVLAVIVGIVMLVTAAMRFCPIYRIFGLRTCKS